jgi:hypothetical protein
MSLHKFQEVIIVLLPITHSKKLIKDAHLSKVCHEAKFALTLNGVLLPARKIHMVAMLVLLITDDTYSAMAFYTISNIQLHNNIM